MPCPERKTISASQVAGLFNVSPYVTRWMLYHYFKNGIEIDSPENDRMSAGLRLQPAILKWASDELRLSVVANEQDSYERHTELPIGATLDGEVWDDALGRGVVEAKNVDWLVWKQQWTATAAPKHIEIQLQAQMQTIGARWGVIACLVGGNDLILYRREAMPELWEQIGKSAVDLFKDIEAGREPDPFGAAIELPVLDALYPVTDEAVVIDLREDAEILDLYERWEYSKTEAAALSKVADQLKARIVGKTKDAGKALTAEGDIYISRTEVPASLLKLSTEQSAALKSLDPDFSGIVTRKGFVRTTMSIRRTQAADPTVTPEYMEAYREFGEGAQRTQG